MAFVIVWLYNYLLDTAPSASREQRTPKPRLAEFIVAKTGDHDLEIRAMGIVRPARLVELKSPVSGAISSVDSDRFQPGGVFRAGEVMLEIDERNFVIALEIRKQETIQAGMEFSVLQATLAQAQANLAQEEGRQVIARQEYELLGREISDKTQLTRLLREPQLAEAKAAVNAVKTRMEMATAAHLVAVQREAEAQLALDRTKVKAPFDATILERFAEVGDHATTSTRLATLCGTESAWIEVSIPSSTLLFVDLPDMSPRTGRVAATSPVAVSDDVMPFDAKIFHPSAWKAEEFRHARILRDLPSETVGGRQAQLLLDVLDPFALSEASREAKLPRVRLNAFVEVVIQGRTLDNVVKLPRKVLRESNTLWLATSNDLLTIKQVTPLRSSREDVFVAASELPAGSRVISSNLPTAVEGLLLRLREANTTATEAKGE